MSDDAPAMIDVLVLLSVRSAVFTLQQIKANHKKQQHHN
jgi:hypothetical protein